MESKEIGRFTVEEKKLALAGRRIYFNIIDDKGEGPGYAQACYDTQIKRFIKCRNRVGITMETAIKEAFELK